MAGVVNDLADNKTNKIDSYEKYGSRKIGDFK